MNKELSVKTISIKDLHEALDTLFNLTEINYENKLMKQSSYITFFSTLYAEVTKKVEQQKILIDQAKGLAKIEAIDKSPTKLSVDMLNTISDTNTVVVRAKLELTELEEKQNLIKGALKGLEHQKDCLIQISSNKRQERKAYE